MLERNFSTDFPRRIPAGAAGNPMTFGTVSLAPLRRQFFTRRLYIIDFFIVATLTGRKNNRKKCIFISDRPHRVYGSFKYFLPVASRSGLRLSLKASERGPLGSSREIWLPIKFVNMVKT